MMDTKNNAAIADTTTLIHCYSKAGNLLQHVDLASASSCYSRALELFSHVGLRAVTDLLSGLQLENMLAGIFDVCLAQSHLLWVQSEESRGQVMSILSEAESLLPYCSKQHDLAETFAKFGIALQQEKGDHAVAIVYLNKALAIKVSK